MGETRLTRGRSTQRHPGSEMSASHIARVTGSVRGRRLVGAQRGLGWLIDQPGEVIGSWGEGPGASTSLLTRVSDNRTYVALTNRRARVGRVNGHVVSASTHSGGAAR